MGQKSKILGVHVPHPIMMSVGDNDNIQTYIQIYRSQKTHTYIKSAKIKWDREAKC